MVPYIKRMNLKRCVAGDETRSAQQVDVQPVGFEQGSPGTEKLPPPGKWKPAVLLLIELTLLRIPVVLYPERQIPTGFTFVYIPYDNRITR